MMKGGERAFAEAYVDDAIVQQLVGQLPWPHKVLVLTRLKKAEQKPTGCRSSEDGTDNMALQPAQVLIYHITDVENLPNILADNGLHSDAVMAQRSPTVIGYSHIKERRLKEIRIPCCSNRFVGEFVPFYFCPRSPMLYTINKGNTGPPPGCQATIVHLVSNVGTAVGLGQDWAISDGNAGAFHTSFDATVGALNGLDWPAIRASNWQGKTHEKSSEFLIEDFFPWTCIQQIGCHNSTVARQVKAMIQNHNHQTSVDVQPTWYY